MFHLLAGAAEGERSGRHILGEGGAGRHGHPFAEADRCHQHRIRARFAAGSDHGAVLVDAVVVGGDRAGADVHLAAQIGIAQIAQVVGFHAALQPAVLHLHEVADPAVGPQLGAVAQLGEWPHAAALGHPGAADHRVHHLHALRQAAVLDQAARPDPAAGADRGAAAEMALGFHHHIAAEAGVIAEGAAGRIDEAHPLAHPVLAQALLQQRFALGQLQPVVDAVGFAGIGHLQVHRRLQHRHGVGEVKLALVVVGAELGQHLRQFLPVEAVDAGVGEADAALLLAAVAVFHDCAHVAGFIGNHAAVTRGIGQPCGEQGHRGTAGPVPGEQLLQGFLPQQGHIAIEHQQLAAEAGQRLQQLLHGVAGAVLGLLQHEFQAVVAGQGGLHPGGLVAHDQQLPLRPEVAAAAQHPLHEGGAGQGLQHLGQVAFHAGALSGGQDGNGEHRQGRAAGRESTGPRQPPAAAPGTGAAGSRLLLLLPPPRQDRRRRICSRGIAVRHAGPAGQMLLLHGAERPQALLRRQGHGAGGGAIAPAAVVRRRDRRQLQAGQPQPAAHPRR